MKEFIRGQNNKFVLGGIKFFPYLPKPLDVIIDDLFKISKNRSDVSGLVDQDVSSSSRQN